MKKLVLLALVCLICTASAAMAMEGDLRGSVDVTYQSQYIWRGFAIFGEKSAIQTSVDLDLYGTGFGVNLMMHRANSSGYENGERWDYTLYYNNLGFLDTTYETLYRLNWVYYNFPDNSSNDFDLQEINAVLTWPKILGVDGLVPSYVIVKDWPAKSGSLIGSPKSDGTASGWAHILMLDYPVAVPGILPDTPEQVLNFHTELVFNDGVGPGGQNVDHDWSNFVFGVSTEFDMGNSMTFTPAIYHQISMEDTVNTNKSETWATFNMKYTF